MDSQISDRTKRDWTEMSFLDMVGVKSYGTAIGLFSYCKKGEPNLAPVSQVDACYRKDVNDERFLSRSPKTTAHSFFVSSFLKKLQIRAGQQSVGLLPPLFVPKPAVFYFLARSRFNARQLPPISKRIASAANTRQYFYFKIFNVSLL